MPNCAQLCPTVPNCAQLCPTVPNCAQLCPTGITNGLGKLTVAHHIRHLQVFEIDRVVLASECQRHLMLELTPLALDFQMVALAQRDRLASAVAPLRAT